MEGPTTTTYIPQLTPPVPPAAPAPSPAALSPAPSPAPADVDADAISFNSWDELDMPPDLLRGIYAYGFETPSIIQKQAIIPMSRGRDIIAQAQSGTGKTATFSIGGLMRIQIPHKYCQLLVFSPTRELATQTAQVITSLASSMQGLVVKTMVGGSSIRVEDCRAHVIVGCPGRIYDMLQRKHIDGGCVKMVVLDEADEMLSAGFKEQLMDIFRYIGERAQVGLFSATMPPEMQSVANAIVRNPARITVKTEQLTLEGIKQYYVQVEDDRQKYATLKDLYERLTVSQCIIYCNSIHRVDNLYDAMLGDKFPVCRIHGNMDKVERERTFADFRNGTSRVMISSNVTARGIDIQQVSVVINFDLARDVNTYLHRIGRSGRWGRKGTSVCFVSASDMDRLKAIESHYATQITELPGNFSV